MSLLDAARLVIYRFHEKGMEIFLISSDLEKDPDVWKLPDCCMVQLNEQFDHQEFIEIEMSDISEGKIIAVEGDWHNMPSIRGLIKHDVKLVKSMVKEMIPGIEKGAFFVFKEGVKKVLPSEYNALKELKDILVDRNSIRNL